MTETPLVDVQGLSVALRDRGALRPIVKHVHLSLAEGRALCIIGASGSGKSVMLRALMGLHPRRQSAVSGQVVIGRHDILTLTERQLAELRGPLVSMIFQEPATALDPVHTIGSQLVETIRRHRRLQGHAAWAQAKLLLEMVAVPAAERRLGSYPHELSGERDRHHRALPQAAGQPRLLLADEPTTALDATVQIQVLLLLKRLKVELGMGLILVTHDLGVAAEIADEVAVMHEGEIVEHGSVEAVLLRPAHAYTRQLIAASKR